MSRARIFDLQILTALLFASLLSGFPLEMSASSPASQPSAVETAAFIKSLQGLPAQYRADLLLMALSNSKPTERLPYTELLKNTIRDLVADVEQYPQYYAGTRSSSDTIEMETATASAYVGLDALTLRTRLLRMLSTTDRAWTIKEMERTRIPLERIECSASLVPDVSGYYQLISDLNFSSGESAPLSRVIWLRDHIGEVSSPVAIPDIANLLSQIAFKPEDLKILALQFNSTLSRLKATDREATYLFNGRSSSTYITALVKRLRRDGIDPSGTTHAYRQFLTNSLGETRCADSTTDWTNAVSQFNELSRENDAAAPAPQLSWNDVMQQPLGTVRASERAIPDPQDIEEALGKMYRLRTQAPASLQASSDDDQAMVWQTLGAEIIRDSDRADSLADYCDECRYFFREKVYLGAFDLMPSTLPEKRRFLSLAIDQISADPSQRTLPALWMLHLKMILGLSRKIGKAEAGKLQKMQSEGNFATFAPSIPSVEVFEELMKSNNFIVSRYVAAERMYQPTFTTPYLE